MKYRVLVLALSIFFTTHVVAKDFLNIMIYNLEKIPYEFDAPGNVQDVVYYQVLSSLLEVKNGVIQPKLLKKVYYDYQNDEYVFEMHENTYFHNNRRATLDDLEFSILRDYYIFQEGESDLGRILGIDKIAQLKLKKFQRGVVEGIKQELPNKLRIKLENPDPDFLYNFTEWKYSLVPMEELETNLLNWKSYPIGAGPYKVIYPGFQNGQLQLKKFAATAKLPVDEINIHTKFVKNITYDFSLFDLPKGFKEFYTKAPIKQLGISFSNANELGNNFYFRKFVQAAINTKDLEKHSNAYKSVFMEPNPQLSDNSLWGTKLLTPHFNPNLAKEYFEKIPKHLRKKEWLVTIFSKSNELPADRKEIYAELKRILASYGFQVKFVPYTQQILPKELAEQAAFEINLYMVHHYQYLSRFSQFMKDSPDLYLRPLPDPVLENHYANALSAKTRDEKFCLVNKLTNYLQEQAYWVPLLESGNNINYNPKTIKKLSENEDELLFLKVDKIVLAQ